MDNIPNPVKVLIAALSLEDDERSPFTSEEVVIEAWKKYPQSFGLDGAKSQFPDSSKVSTLLMGKRGLVRKGLLFKKEGIKTKYLLTPEGRNIAHEVLGEDEEIPTAHPPKVQSFAWADSPNAHLESFLTRVMNSTALFKFKEGTLKECTFGDACVFWGLGNPPSLNLTENQEKFRTDLQTVEGIITLPQELILKSGMAVGWKEVKDIQKASLDLTKRFFSHIHLLKVREIKSKEALPTNVT